jgi:5-formyltetrahydrofolate cyclo-ligase
MNKEEARSIYSKARSNCSIDQCARLSKQICEQIKDWDVFQNATSVAIYMKFHKEVDLRPLLTEKKQIVIPKVEIGEQELSLYKIHHISQTRPGYMQILEPDESCKKIDDVDLALIPGICFSEDGGRVGYGKGYFDKLLANLSCIKVGIGYDLQITPTLTMEEHDIPMDYIITDKRIINCGE